MRVVTELIKPNSEWYSRLVKINEDEKLGVVVSYPLQWQRSPISGQ